MENSFISNWLTIVGLLLLYFAGVLFLVLASRILVHIAVQRHRRDRELQKRQEPIRFIIYDSFGNKKEIDERIRARSAEIKKRIRGA